MFYFGTEKRGLAKLAPGFTFFGNGPICCR